jgi:hypothetical protein
MPPPIISVIRPKMLAGFLGARMESIKGQTYKNIEIISYRVEWV